jgi:hypothetical protein
MTRLRTLFAFSLFSVLAATIAACGGGQEDEGATLDDGSEDELTTVTPDEQAAASATDISGFELDTPTPTGIALFKAARYWLGEQSNHKAYPKARQCANNVSKVAALAGLMKDGNLPRYDAEAVSRMISIVKSTPGGKVFRLAAPVKRADGTLDKKPFIDSINAMYGGRIPTGTFVAGCHSRLCDSEPGEQHIGMIGDTDENGIVWAYHNNWYRPDNEGSRHDWRPYMIFTHLAKRADGSPACDFDPLGKCDATAMRGSLAEKYYNNVGGTYNYVRSWMPTPWLKVTRDASGTIIDADSLVGAIDDLDPFGKKYGNKPSYFMTLAVVPELDQELSTAAR